MLVGRVATGSVDVGDDPGHRDGAIGVAAPDLTVAPAPEGHKRGIIASPRGNVGLRAAGVSGHRPGPGALPDLRLPSGGELLVEALPVGNKLLGGSHRVDSGPSLIHVAPGRLRARPGRSGAPFRRAGWTCQRCPLRSRTSLLLEGTAGPTRSTRGRFWDGRLAGEARHVPEARSP